MALRPLLPSAGNFLPFYLTSYVYSNLSWVAEKRASTLEEQRLRTCDQHEDLY